MPPWIRQCLLATPPDLRPPTVLRNLEIGNWGSNHVLNDSTCAFYQRQPLLAPQFQSQDLAGVPKDFDCFPYAFKAFSRSVEKTEYLLDEGLDFPLIFNLMRFIFGTTFIEQVCRICLGRLRL